MLFRIFSFLVLNLQVVVLKIFGARGIGFAGNVKNMRNSKINQLLGFECRLEWAHENA